MAFICLKYICLLVGFSAVSIILPLGIYPSCVCPSHSPGVSSLPTVIDQAQIPCVLLRALHIVEWPACPFPHGLAPCLAREITRAILYASPSSRQRQRREFWAHTLKQAGAGDIWEEVLRLREHTRQSCCLNSRHGCSPTGVTMGQVCHLKFLMLILCFFFCLSCLKIITNSIVMKKN